MDSIKFCKTAIAPSFLLLSLSRAMKDERPCKEKLKGPFASGYVTPEVVPLITDENSSVTVHCRVTCQDPNGTYSSLLRVVTTEDGEHYESGNAARYLYDLSLLTNNSCNYSRNVAEFEYMYRITVKNPSVNRSIVMCGLQYVSVEHDSERCFSSNVAWITLPKAISEKDNRPCNEKLEGPFDSNGLSVPIVRLRADNNNSVVVQCRITCQDLDGYYSPFVRIVILENGSQHDNANNTIKDLYELTLLMDDSCKPGSNLTEFEYMYKITAKSERFNRSIAMCGLHYTPRQHYSEERCLSTNVAWIILDEAAVPTTAAPTCTQKETHTIATTVLEEYTTTVTSDEPTASVIDDEIKIPPSVTFSLIPILVITVVILLGLTVVILLIRQKYVASQTTENLTIQNNNTTEPSQNQQPPGIQLTSRQSLPVSSSEDLPGHMSDSD